MVQKIPKKRGRQRLAFDSVTTDPNKAALMMSRFIFDYLSGLKGVFKKGNIKYKIEKGKVEMMYYNLQELRKTRIDSTVVIDIDYSTITKREETIWMIQDFVLNSYYAYEWDGKPVEIETLATILYIEKRTVGSLLRKIQDKIGMLGNGILDDGI